MKQLRRLSLIVLIALSPFGEVGSVNASSSAIANVKDGDSCRVRGQVTGTVKKQFVCVWATTTTKSGRVIGRRLVWELKDITTTTTTMTTTTTTIPRTCAQGGRCSVGDKGPGGGIIFYVSSTNQTWGQALEAAPPSANWNPSGLDPSAPWGCGNVAIPAARGINVGDGLRNTLAIIKDCPTPGIAAHIAESLSFGGKDDWFLPSLEETILLFNARAVVPGLRGIYYWTSTEYDHELCPLAVSLNRALCHVFAEIIVFNPTANGNVRVGTAFSGRKVGSHYLRPIRYVSPVN